jgi:hypothetical protein
MAQALMQDLKFTVRMLRKNLASTVVAVAIIALGTGAVSTIFSVANAIVLRPLPGVTTPSELAIIERTQPTWRFVVGVVSVLQTHRRQFAHDADRGVVDDPADDEHRRRRRLGAREHRLGQLLRRAGGSAGDRTLFLG